MKKKVTLLIHGPLSGNALDEIFKAYSNWHRHEAVSVILVCYADEKNKTEKYLRTLLGVNQNIKIITVKDLINPGFFNINRQLISVRAGLKEIMLDEFVIKLRNDQWIDFNKLEKYLEKLSWLNGEEEKIITTNCFTRKDRLYHPSDMFLCGYQSSLMQYYSVPLMEETHLECEAMILKKLKNKVPFAEAFVCPEIWLFSHFITSKGWEKKYTEKDSYDAIRAYCHIINSWEIEFRWKKDRTPFKGEGAIILPQYWSWPPFDGMEDEEISCYCRSDFEGEFTSEDKKYIEESKKVWANFEKQCRRGESKSNLSSNKKLAIFILKNFRSFVRSFVYPGLKIIGMVLPYCITVSIRRLWNSSWTCSKKDRIKEFLRK